MSHSEVVRMTVANRRLIADLLEGLDDEQWRAETLCRGWTVHHMAAHLVQPMLVGFGRFFATALRYRGDTDKTVDHLARRLARRSRSELVTTLRERADDGLAPARVGPMGPFADTCIHLRDIARPLGLAVDVPQEHWVVLLDYLTADGVAPALVPAGRLDGLALAATDAEWSRGDGEPVRGPVEALALAVTGRVVALGELSGAGVARLSERLRG